MRVRAAIFDMDGLLVDSLPLWAEAEVSTFNRYGAPITIEDCTQTASMRLEECIKYWFEAHSISGFSHDIVAGEFVDAVVQLVQSKAVPMRGAVELIQRLHALGLKLAVASQSPLSVISATVAKFGVEDCFQLLHTAEDEEQGKPHPAVYQTVLSRLGVDAGCCIAFEDAVSGVQSANAAGLRVYAVPAPSDYNRTEFDIAEAKLRSLSDFPISDLK